MTTDKESHTERAHTDDSLRGERHRTDRALASKIKDEEVLADGIVERARKRADEVLDAAREKEDEELNPNGPEASAPVAAAEAAETKQERAEEDVALEQENSAADDKLSSEREKQSRTLAERLPRERQKTDSHLRAERARSDSTVVHRDDAMGIISHELGNLVASIVINAKWMAMQASDSDEGRRTLSGTECIAHCADRMNKLIGDLVDVASIDAGKLAVHPQPGDVIEMIHEAITPFEYAAREKGLSLVFATGGQVLPGVFDRNRMLQVVTNLIANAMRFTSSGGVITLKAAHAGDDLRVTVLDTGEGIAADMREVIFERFGQVGGNDHRGLGLGLYISKYIVEAQGGRIWAESNPAGTGTAFHLTIPAAARLEEG